MKKVTRFFFFAALFCATFENIHWNAAGTVYLADLTAAAFLVSFALCSLEGRAGRIPRVAASLTMFLGVFLLVCGVLVTLVHQLARLVEGGDG